MRRGRISKTVVRYSHAGKDDCGVADRLNRLKARVRHAGISGGIES